jgi:hypothetical protein
MKKKLLPILIVLTLIGLIAMPAVYVFVLGNPYEPLLDNVLALPLVYVEFVTTWLAAISFSGLTNLIVVGGTGLGFVLALLVLIRGIIARRPILGIISFIAGLTFFILGVSLVIPGAFGIADLRYLNYLIDGLSTNLLGTIFLASLVGLVILFLFLMYVLGFVVKAKAKRTKVKQAKLVQTPVAASPAANPSTPSLQPASLIQPTPTPSTPASQDSQLTDLVKLVMAEELNAMRGGYAAPANPGYAMNVPPQGYGMDVNLIRRIVVEELAKFQGHYISRPEAQVLIAQEIAMIKAQLKIK